MTDEDVANLYAGDFYVNIHSEAFPPGEIRGQIDGCFDGPGGLCLNDQRFQVTVDWTTAEASGTGRAIPETDDSGLFYFFAKDNIEFCQG